MNELTTSEAFKLIKLEKVILKGARSFVAVGNALATIRDERLYRDEHDTFESYCLAVWGWSRQRGYQMIQAAEVVEALPPTFQKEVLDERDARALSGLDRGDQQQVIREAKTDGVSITEKAKTFSESPVNIDRNVSTVVDISLSKPAENKLVKRILELESELDSAQARIAILEESLADYPVLQKECEMMTRILSSDDMMADALATIKMLSARVRVAEERVAGLQGERNMAIQAAKRNLKNQT